MLNIRMIEYHILRVSFRVLDVVLDLGVKSPAVKMNSPQELPKMHRALVLTSTSQPLEVKTIPTPQLGCGSAVVRVEAANIISYSKNIYHGTRHYPFRMPLVIGNVESGQRVYYRGIASGVTF